MAHHPSAGHGSPDDEYTETPAGSTYEHTDADTRPLVRFLIGCVISAVVIHFGLAGAYQLLVNVGIAKEVSERQYPMSGGQEHPLPPAPRLQQFPENERFEFNARNAASSPHTRGRTSRPAPCAFRWPRRCG